MDTEEFKIELRDPAWLRALTLPERVASLRDAEENGRAAVQDKQQSERRMRRWLSEPVFADDRERMAERLAQDGAEERDLERLLGEPAEVMGERFPEAAGWVKQAARAFSVPEPVDSTDVGNMGFLEVARPLILEGRRQLRAGIEDLTRETRNLPFDPDTIEDLLYKGLPERLFTILSRTLVLELNVARLQELLGGETPEERFQSFVERLGRKEVSLAVLQEYPVLARQIVLSIDNWFNVSLEFVRRLCEDWDTIVREFFPDEPVGLLVDLEGGAGDLHRGGHSVYIATFDPGLRLVYKPRSLAVDVHFQELLSWLNERGDHPPFRLLKVLDLGTHGWVEYVAKAPCSSAAEVRRFYERQGGYLALLHALSATDFHLENLIAAGEHPVLIDLESLFHPSHPQMEDPRTNNLAGSALNSSVLRVGLLPTPTVSNHEQAASFDMSGLGGVDGQTSPNPLPRWQASDTDEMRLVREHAKMPGAHNRPSLNDTAVDTLNYTEEIVEGFSRVYRLLLGHRDDLLSEKGPLARFADDEVRYIVRGTQDYQMRLIESYHPDLLRDALDRDRFFDNLWSSAAENPKLHVTFPHERDDLYQGDIPLFTTRPRSCDLWDSANRLIRNFFDASGLSISRQYIRELSEDHLAQQAWFIRASLTALTLGEGRSWWPSHRFIEPQEEAGRDQLLDAARAVGDRLEFLALQGDRDVSWVGLTLVNERNWMLLPLDTSLYSGSAGVALFLGYLGSYTQEERYTALAQKTVSTIRRQLQQVEATDLSGLSLTIGGFEQLGGAVYLLTHLGTLWEDREFLDQAEAISEDLISPLIDEDDNLDLISGAAGCIGVLLGLHSVRPSDQLLNLAIRCGDHLIARSEQTERGVGWPSSDSPWPLAGFSHGAAGVSWAMLELWKHTGQTRFYDTAMAAIEYERSLFSAERYNWPDLRELEKVAGPDEPEDDQSFMVAWCHGAPGVGLSRLRALKHSDDATTRAEIDAALRTTLAEGFGGNHCLCHGDLGNLELLLQASELLGDERLRSRTYRIASGILKSIDEQGWLCGVPAGVETPTLMMGIAGIGYGLLRLSDPDLVPSALVLDPPRMR